MAAVEYMRGAVGQRLGVKKQMDFLVLSKVLMYRSEGRGEWRRLSIRGQILERKSSIKE